MRLYFGAVTFLLGMVLVIITYLGLIESWGWIASALLLITGLGSLMAACYGVCMLRSVFGR